MNIFMFPQVALHESISRLCNQSYTFMQELAQVSDFNEFASVLQQVESFK